MSNTLLWVIFNIFVIILLIVDLKVFHRQAHEISIKEALWWTAFWIVLALVFNMGVYLIAGHQKALEYLAGYLIEKSLSVDNLFVFLLIFTYFKVPQAYQHNVLFWGIFGALVLRAVFILTGITLITHFHWMIYVFGIFLIFTGLKLAFQKEKELHPEKNPILKIVRKVIPLTKKYKGERFFIKRKRQGKTVIVATPLLVILILIETTDVMFALDSIPAILAISHDPFIVYSSNVFAILGLRALYFALDGVMRLFRFLHYGLALILVFVGIKMIIADIYHLPIWLALGFIAVVLTLSVLTSVLIPEKEGEKHASHHPS